MTRVETLHYWIEAATADGVAGWAVADDDLRVSILIDGLEVGTARRGIPRPDVEQLHPDLPNSGDCGFSFPLRARHFAHVDRPIASLIVRFETKQAVELAEPVEVPVPLRPSAADRAPFPPGVARLILAAGVGSEDDPRWDDERMALAADALGMLVARGTRRNGQLYRYLSFVAQVWGHAQFVERNFPRVNPTYQPGSHDAAGVATSSEELVSVAVHLGTLRALGLGGHLLEFGCFKGHSTCVLSFACSLLGARMDVFDSFEGLPPSDSGFYRAGEYAGGLAEVKANVAALGRPEVLTFHKGFFADSLARWNPCDIALLWMDVDLESSAQDVMRILEHLPSESALFTHECFPENFVNGRVVTDRSPDRVLGPILDGFAACGRDPVGRFIAGHTGALWDVEGAVPVLATDALLKIKDIALGL